MISDVELDRRLTAFVAQGGERAPLHDLEAALATIAHTPQRQARPWRRSPATRPAARRWAWYAAAALLLVALAVATAVGIGALRPPWSSRLPVAPDGPTVIEPSQPAVLPAASATTIPVPEPSERAEPSGGTPVTLAPFAADDWAVTLAIPAGWTEQGDQISEFRHFGGTDPEGHLSVTNENPYGTAVCDPDCAPFDVPTTIPYDADAQLAALKASIASHVGATDWQPLADPPDGLVGGASIETTAVAGDGRMWRRIHVVGLKARNVVAIAWSQPDEVFDRALFQRVMAGVQLGDAPEYSDGDLLTWTDGAFTIPNSGLWWWSDTPEVAGLPLTGVRRLADGRVIVSIGSPDGTFGWCDPACREIAGLTSLDALVAAVRGDTLAVRGDTTLDGEPARALVDLAAVDDRLVVLAMHDGRPVGIRLDVGEWNVADGVLAEMVGGFRFAAAQPALPVDRTFSLAGGRVELGLSDEWSPVGKDPIRLERGKQTLTVRVGDADGRITTCDTPAGPWEHCRAVTAKTVDELIAALRPNDEADPHDPALTPTVDSITLDGEPARIMRVQSYDRETYRPVAVFYLVAIHDGRPVIARIRADEDDVADLGSVLAGFRFVD